jgi:pimeloyl-ACP methyl ester carboxylesterase
MQTSTRRTRSGLPIAVERDDSGGPVDAVFVHATGFCKELWRPVIDEVTRHGRPLAWMSMDQRGHGASGRGEPPYRWDLLADDLLDVLEPGSPTGVGHSSGGAAIAGAEIKHPGTFSELVLIEPIITPPPFERRDTTLARVADRRRSWFPDRPMARDRFAKGAFASWDPAVLDLYIEHGFADAGNGIQLACAPSVEADFYREGSNHDTWDHLAEIEAPVTVVVGELSTTHTDPYLSMLVAGFRHAELIVVPERGHLVPMEDPSAVARVVDDVIARR